MDEPAVVLCEGFLKQQIVDDAGLYSWKKRYFILLDSGDLKIQSQSGSDDGAEVTSALGIKSAREWRVSSPAAGYGFDTVWASGKLW
jgi:hypothetical protein